MTDEYAGQGGSYILDPKTGKRTRVEDPTKDSQAPTAPETSTGAPPSPLGGEGPGEREDAPANVAPLTRRRKPTDEGS